MTRAEFLILKAKVMARRALLAEMAASPMGYTLNQEQMGVLLMMAGVSLRTNGAPVEPNMVTIWLDEESASGIVIRETGWLRQTRHIIKASDTGYIVSERGWAALDEHLANEREACRQRSPDDSPVLTAKEIGPHALITMGDRQITAEARRLTAQALTKARGRIG